MRHKLSDFKGIKNRVKISFQVEISVLNSTSVTNRQKNQMAQRLIFGRGIDKK